MIRKYQMENNRNVKYEKKELGNLYRVGKKQF